MAALIRTFFLSSIFIAAIMAGYWKYSSSRAAFYKGELEALKTEMAERIRLHEEMLERLGRDERLAHIHILDQSINEEGVVEDTTFEFIELDDDGGELARRTFTIPGQVLFVDAWTVKFNQDDVAMGHPLRGRTMVLLRRIYSDQVPPIEGCPIDTPGGIPAAYATTEVASFEQALWRDFWKLATDPEMAARLGVRVAQGEAVYKPVLKGNTYEFSVDAAGGINLLPMPKPHESSEHNPARQ
ncbi:MAG: hypothetical protein ACR2GY_03850 [Phycisphaerales bacterium]